MNQETTRREALIYMASAAGVLATAAGAGSAHAQSGHRDSHMDDGEKKMSSHDLESCIDECRACHQLCVETIRYCLEKGGRHANPQHVGLLIDCAEICQTNSNFMMRRSPDHKIVCEACASICERCAKSCDAFGDDAQLKSCAEACRSCAAACRDMSRSS